MALTISTIVCAYNEADYIGPCLQSLCRQSRPPDEILVVNNASTDETAAIAADVTGVRVIDEPQKGLVRAREAGRLAATGDLLVYLDADCRAPEDWLRRVERRFDQRPLLVECALIELDEKVAVLRDMTVGPRRAGVERIDRNELRPREHRMGE